VIELNKPKDYTKDGSEGRGAGKLRDILGNRVETDTNVPRKDRSAPGFRGDLSLCPPPSGTTPDPDLYRLLEGICAPEAIAVEKSAQGSFLTLDKGKCIMCGICQQTAPSMFQFQSGFALPKRKLNDLIVVRLSDLPAGGTELKPDEIGKQLRGKIMRTLGRSLAIREVDAGSCNGCETEVSALNNPIYDVERFGVHFVASPRHADVLLVTGVGSRNMELALKRTYDATPDPKVVVAVGACACTGGLFGDTYATSGGIAGLVPVDVFVPGCPPRPEALLYGLLLAVDRIR